MEDNSTQGRKSSNDFHDEKSSGKKNSLSESVNNSSSSMRKDLSKIIYTDTNSEKESTSLKQSTPSAKSELITIDESFKETNSKFKLSGSGSKSKTSFETTKGKSNSVSQKTSSMKFERVSSNYLSRIDSKETNLDQLSRKSSYHFGKASEETTTLKSAATEKISQSGLHNSSLWAESSTSKPTISKSTTKSNEVKDNFDNLKCIPPWAKTLRQVYGMTSSDNDEEVMQENLQDKIKSLMEKHSRLMLIKRKESKKQILLEPNEYGDMGKVKVATKNTRYYMSPIPRDTFRDDIETKTSLPDFSPHSSHDSNVMEVTKKTSKTQTKKEVSAILKSLYNSKTQRDTVKKDNNLRKEPTICPKITPSNIRDYVKAQTLDPDSQKLHEIIKIKKVPSFGTQVGLNPSSKYIINVPRSTKAEGPTINKITVKEKRKIRIDSAEDINENVTQIVYNNDSELQQKKGGYTADQVIQHDVVPYPKQHKSPTKTRTLKVTAERTPIISDMVKKEEKGKDKILLIQYEKKSKPGKEKSEAEPTLVSTQLLGIRKPCNEDVNEMYLYGTERNGKKCKETITQVDDVSPTLREKVNMIFQELRDMTFKPCEELVSSPESKPSVTTQSTQHPSTVVQTDAVSIQAYPDIRSREVQVTDSLFFHQRQSLAEQTTMKSEGDKNKSLSPLEDVTDDFAVPGEAKQKEIYSKEQIDMHSIQETTDVSEEKVSETDDEVVISEVEEKKTSAESRKRTTGDYQVEGEEHTEETEPGDEKTDERDDEVRSLLEVQSGIKSIESQEELSSDQLSPDVDHDELESDKADEPLEILPEYEKEETMSDASSLMEKSSSEDDHHSEGIEELEGDEDILNLKEQDDIKDSHTVAGDEDAYRRELGNLENPFFSEDIRSYDFDPAQNYELKMISSSKFFHQRDSLRKLNWTEDIIYLENNLCPQLTRALAEIAIKQPEDPISYLAHWIYKDYENRESEEKNSVFKEHLEMAKGMITSKKDPEMVCKKFSLRRYPLKSYSTVELSASKTSDITVEEEPDTEDI